MSKRAWLYIYLVFMAAALAVGIMLSHVMKMSPQWFAFGAMALFATISQIYEAQHGRQSYYPHLVFFFAAVLLLEPFLFVLVVAIPHLVEWAGEYVRQVASRRAWYIQPFNIATHILAGAGAYFVTKVIPEHIALLALVPPMFPLTVAALIYVLINHLLIGGALSLARGIPFKESGLLGRDSLLPDFMMACLGVVVGLLWDLDPWWILLALAPLVLMYQALLVPKLKQEAQTDSKTGLLNARHFGKEFASELQRAQRFNRPFAVVMADLDLLRNVNNTYGHLAGDIVLTGVARIIRENIREGDIAGRFGGEEFALVLPESGRDGARLLAERLRAVIAAAQFPVSTSSTPISVTMSFGIACFPEDATQDVGLMHEADVAVYYAKSQGRNRVVCAADVPYAVKLAHLPSQTQPAATPASPTAQGEPS